MSSLKLSEQDKRELEKYTKFLALKAVQVIIQSRCGNKIITKCKPNVSGTDWFNLAVNDIPEIWADTKRQIGDDIIASPGPLCVEISLRTNENDIMVLETWSFEILPEQSDCTVQITYTIYNRMGILLKSLLSISRITPAYKLSRRQAQDSYVICYRIYTGEPAIHELGDNYKHVKVGNLSTPIGMIYLSVFYRTKMTISPTQAGRESIMLKSDHFYTDSSPRHAQQNENDSKSLNDIIKVGAFVDMKLIPKKKTNSDENIPFSSLLTPRQTSSSPVQSTETANATQIITTTVSGSATDISSNGNEQSASDSATPKCNSQNGSRRSSCSMTSTNDDYIMVDLKTPFATTNTNSDLGTFYRECQSAPQLQAFMEEQTLVEQVGDLTKQLEAFETSMHHYEDVWNSICKSENNN